LDFVERVGNRLPDPVTLFVLFAVLVVVVSAVAARAGVAVAHPTTGETIAVVDLATGAGVRRMLTEAVKNFAAFPPLGTVLTVMIGAGVCEKSGLFGALLRQLVRAVPRSALTAALVFAGVNASAAADAGIVVLTPLGALLFASVGRHPMVGLIAAFVGVSGGFSANLFITALDPLVAGLTETGARLVDPGYRVHATANYYFMFASTFLLTVVGTIVTHRWVEPRLGKWQPPDGAAVDEGTLGPLDAREKRGLAVAGLGFVALCALVALVVVPQGAPLRAADGSFGPFFDAIVVLVTLAFLVPGILYGVAVGKIGSDRDVAELAGQALATMAGYIVLAFAAAQFIAYFAWSNLGLVMAVKGAAGMKALGLGGMPLVIALVLVSATVDLLIASASAKWAALATVFVPMMMLLGLSPELTQAAYRVGDSVSNILTPLMPYFPLLITFARKYDPRAGFGTLMASTLPYAVAFLLMWTALLVVWMLFDLPLGPGAPIHYSPAR
jgi:aminobenzoyl-glutamate transport protein